MGKISRLSSRHQYMPPAPSLKATAARLLLINDNTEMAAIQEAGFRARLPAWKQEVPAATDAATLGRLFVEFIDGTNGYACFDAAMQRKRANVATSLRRTGVTLTTVAKHVHIYRTEVIDAGRRAWRMLKASTGGPRRSWKANSRARQSAYARGTHDLVHEWRERFGQRVQGSKKWRADNFVQVNGVVADLRPSSTRSGVGPAAAWDRHVGRPLLRGKGYIVLPTAGTLLATETLERLRNDGIARLGSSKVCHP